MITLGSPAQLYGTWPVKRRRSGQLPYICDANDGHGRQRRARAPTTGTGADTGARGPGFEGGLGTVVVQVGTSRRELCLDRLGLVHFLDDAQVELVRVGQVLDFAQCLLLPG
jgi:hypothetical protein